MLRTPRSLRLHIAIFGRRNVGKSAVLNALTGQDVAIVSDIAGTTTDPVEKPTELLPLGPVLLVDTAGYDDVGVLGTLRTRKTTKVLDRTDIAILVTEADTWGDYETTWAEEFKRRQIPALVILNKIDLAQPTSAAKEAEKAGLPWSAMSATLGIGVLEAKETIIRTVPDSWYKQAGILDGLVHQGDTVVLVIPLDKEAPKGRIILPQVQTIRDILDKDASALVTNEHNLSRDLTHLTATPRLVITDSQAFEAVARQTPADIPLTSFSIAFARYKGDLDALVAGARHIAALKETDKVLICEACTHHPVGDDIGRNKIPRWLRANVGPQLQCDVAAGHDFPDDLEQYALIVHCGACMFSRGEMLTRIITCQQRGIPITNYGMAIAYLHGILDRALTPFRLPPVPYQAPSPPPDEGGRGGNDRPASAARGTCPR